MTRLIIITLLSLLILSCKPKNAYAPPPPPQVVIAHPIEGLVTPFLEFTGNTQAFRTVELVARVEGFLTQVLLKEGEPVKEGQLLFQIQHDTYDAKLQQAQALVMADKAKLIHAENEFSRYSGLFKKNAAPQTEVDRWLYERDSAKAGLISSEADVLLAKLNVSYTRVTAPFNGIVGRRLKDPGNLVGAGENTVLAEVNQIDSIYAYFTISERDLFKIKAEYSVNEQGIDRVKRIPVYLGLVNEEGYPHQGVMDFAAISVNSTSGTLLLRAIFPNPHFDILPGLFARVKAIISSPVSALLIPDEIVGLDQQGNYVLIMDENNTVQRRSVKKGVREGKMVVIDEGISLSDWVVVNGIFGAVPGKTIKPVKDVLKIENNQLSQVPNKDGLKP